MVNQVTTVLPRGKWFWRTLLGFTLLLSATGLNRFAAPAIEAGELFTMRRWLIPASLGTVQLLLTLIVLALTWTPWRKMMGNVLRRGIHLLAALRWANLALYAFVLAFFAWLILGRYGFYFAGLSTRLWLFWLCVLAGGLLLKAWWSGRKQPKVIGWPAMLALSLLLATSAYKVTSYLPDISAYPFTLGWSETSRYYYASLFFSERLYGISVPPTVLHPSRYLMQAIPYLIPSSPLWLHRLWQVFLWLGTTALSSWIFIRRMDMAHCLKHWLAGLWVFLFILLGPIYYHLQIPFILILWGFHPNASSSFVPEVKRRRWVFSLLVVVIASAWVGISRVNWFPVPGMLAAAIYLLERTVPAGQTGTPPGWRAILRYALPPTGWFLLGTMIAFAAQTAYIRWSGNAAEQFTTSLSSDLLWYRLLPSPTYPPGILPAILVVSAPLVMFAWGTTRQEKWSPARWRAFHPIRLLGLGGMLLVLFAGGLVVSVKIGGGSNLHNLDAYLALLLVICGYFAVGKAVPEKDHRTAVATESQQKRLILLRRTAIWLSLAIMAYFTIAGRGPSEHLPSHAQIQKSLEVIQRYAHQANEKGGLVLFISNRHLITFGYVQSSLVAEYERVFLMEMAMAGQPDYMAKFHDDLKNHRFALIIAEPLFQQVKGEEKMFGEENDAWVQEVSRYVLCYYQSEKILRQVRIQIFSPNPSAQACP